MYVENQGILSFDMPSDCFPNLEVCSFAFNRLKDVPRFLYGIPKIQNIYLNNNKIKKFRVNRGSMQKGSFKKNLLIIIVNYIQVEALWLSYNKIRQIDDTMSVLKSLRYLHADHNRISGLVFDFIFKARVVILNTRP